ncbi:exopolysaccharide biosynthesis protein [Qipengyuania marisflavi]|uniref:Exopolysaccharide biosynthesis protein n=1 Tax=Qipengyuania marisflavi TaxID=2486356 RepID=A0A5S3P535_9SPHN|nr:exopolysaccharide biosynthesis protein [Qipengyuania marisflavi]TMM47177.1 exopolysaccharide biosynthesis protein [Qipengyuania marisflavi]
MPHDPHHPPESVEDVLGELDDLASSRSRVCVAHVLRDFGERSFGPFIMLPALMELTPIGGVPFVPTFLAVIIALVAGQLLLGRDHVWMPRFIRSRSVTGKKWHRAVRKLRGIGHWLDSHSEGRLEQLTQGVWQRLVGLVIILLCCTVPPLELLPFASSLPMLAIAMLGLALIVRDGALVLGALMFAGLAAALGGYLYATSDLAESGLNFF